MSRKPRTPVALVVDDEESCRKMLKAVLAMAGFRVLAAGSGPQALKICARPKLPIDIVITDIQMPHVSGFVLAEQLGEIRPLTPVLFISGGMKEGDPELLRRLGPGRGFLRKPFSLALLMSRIGGLRQTPGRVVA